MTIPNNFTASQPLTEEQESMMSMLLDHAKKIREGYGYSGDEKMVPMAFIYGDEGNQIVAMGWKNDREKYLQAVNMNMMARKAKAKTLSLVTDTRWVNGETFAHYFNLGDIKDFEKFHANYHRILNEHGGEIKNLPRVLWKEAVIVVTNGPNLPLNVKMATYEEGEIDTIRWLPEEIPADGFKSDLLKDWWK